MYARQQMTEEVMKRFAPWVFGIAFLFWLGSAIA
jgi:hypothetical protein